jgi:hypothetical protein
MYHYSALRAVFTGMCGPQNSAQVVSDIVDTFELLFDKNLVQKFVNETNCYAQQLKNTMGNTFTKWPRVND